MPANGESNIMYAKVSNSDDIDLIFKCYRDILAQIDCQLKSRVKIFVIL